MDVLRQYSSFSFKTVRRDEVVKFLIKKGADTEAKDNMRNTAEQLA